MEVDKKELKEILDGQRKEYQDYLGIALEDFKSQTKTVTETISRTEIENRNWIKEMKEKYKCLSA